MPHSISREFIGFLMFAFPRNYLHQLKVGHKSFKTWKFHEVIPFTGRESLPNWATWLDRASIEREWQQWHNCHKTAMQVHVQVEAFACKKYGGLRARVQSSIQTPVVLAESSIPATILSNDSSFSWKFDSSNNTLEVQNQIAPNRYSPEHLTAHSLYKIEVVEIEYRSFQREHHPKTVEIRQQSLSLDNKKPFPWPNPTRDTPKDRSESEENNWILCKKPTATCVALRAKEVMPVDCATRTHGIVCRPRLAWVQRVWPGLMTSLNSLPLVGTITIWLRCRINFALLRASTTCLHAW